MLQTRSFFRAGMLLVMLSACAFAFAPPQDSDVQKPQTRTRLLDRSSDELEAAATTRVEPIYPPVAKWAGMTGEVKVYVLINERGDVAEIIGVGTHALLKNAAVTAARGWKFKPAEVNGTAVKVRGILV